jgi:ABC-type multidrug transport system ATPase subunit
LQEIHHTAGFFIEAPAFYKNLTATQNLDLLQKIRGKKTATSELIEMVGLSDSANKKVGKFSKGMKQRLGIAQALIGDPEILVLDEPFHGLDPEVKLFLMTLIKKLAFEEKKAILVSSHLLSDMESMADDFVLLHQGKIHLSGKLSDYRNEKQKVTFWFDKRLKQNSNQTFKIGRIPDDYPNCWQADLSVQETKNFVTLWVQNGFVPYKVEREDLLHSKYMEITK